MKTTSILLAIVSAIFFTVTSFAANWYWKGETSSNWADLENWNSSALMTGSAPAELDDLQNGVLYLSITNSFLPTLQNIPNLVIKELRLDGEVQPFEITGESITLNRIVQKTNPATECEIAIYCPLILRKTEAWNVTSKVTLNVHSEVSEVTSGISFACNGSGVVNFFAPVTITGGFHHNQASARYHGIETVGIQPSELDNDYFSTGYGSMVFFSPYEDDATYEYIFNEFVGAKSTGTFPFNTTENVVVQFNGPLWDPGTNKKFQKSGLGELITNAELPHTGTIEVNNGTWTLNGPLADGIDGATAVFNLGTLDLRGNDLCNRSLIFNNGAGTEHCGNIINSNTEKESKITGNITKHATSSVFTYQFGGIGDIWLAGDIVSKATLTHPLVKVGAGKLRLTGSSNLTGPLQILGGTLHLDYSLNNTNKLYGGANFALHGDLLLTGNAEEDTIEEATDLVFCKVSNVKANSAHIKLQAQNNHTIKLRFSDFSTSYTYDQKGTIDFNPDETSAIQFLATTNKSATGILSGFATFREYSFARISSTADADGYYSVEGLPDNQYATTFDSATEYENLDVLDSATVSATEIVSTLRFNQAKPLTLTLDNSLLVRGGNSGNGYAGGILVTKSVGENDITIEGAGSLCGGDVNGSLFIHQYNTDGALRIHSRLSTTSSGSSLVKTGPGEVVLTNDNSFINVYLHEGCTTVSSIKDTGVNSALGRSAGIYLGNATLKYIGEGDETNRKIVMREPATLDASGTGPILFTNETAIAASTNEGRDNPLTLTGEGEGEIRGIIDLGLGSLIKTGSGKWTLSNTSTNSFLGSTFVNAGELRLDGTVRRNVTVRNGAKISGSGKVDLDLVMEEGAIFAYETGTTPLHVGRNVVLGETTALEVSGEMPFEEWTEIATFDGTIDGEIATLPFGFYSRYDNGAISILRRPMNTLIIIR